MKSYDSDAVAIQIASQLQQKREAREANEIALAEFFARGGQVQQCNPFESGRTEDESYSAWGKPKKKKGEESTLEPEEDLL